MTDARRGLARLAFLAALLAGGPSQGALFQVTVDTTPLNGQSAALGFDLTNAADPPASSVTISGFGIAGIGSSIDNAYLITDADAPTLATALTTPATSVVLSDAGGAFYLEFLQYVTLGSSFTFTFSPSGSPLGTGGDTFQFFILVGTEPPPAPPDLLPLLVDAPLNPNGTGEIVRFEIGVTDPAQPQFFQGETIPQDDTQVPQAIGVGVIPVAVPEPGALALAIAGLLALGVARRPPIRSFVK